MMDSRLLGVTGLGKAVFVMPALALWPLIRHLNVGISISRSWRGIVLFLLPHMKFRSLHQNPERRFGEHQYFQNRRQAEKSD